ncbi:MAG: hypothetical protein RR768_05975 [Clostridium sp.]
MVNFTSYSFHYYQNNMVGRKENRVVQALGAAKLTMMSGDIATK